MAKQSAATRLLYSWRNYAPVLFLYVQGKPADDLLGLCTGFSFSKSVNRAAETRFSFVNPTRKLLEDPRLLPNQKWEFRFGFFNDLSPIHTAIIREVAPEYGSTCNVNVTLYDYSLNMSTRSKGKNWGRVKASEIATRIARSYGMQAVVDDPKSMPAKAYVQPSSVSDIQFLRDIAADLDFEVYVEGTPPILFFRKKDYGKAPRRKLIYRDDPTEYAYVKGFFPRVRSLGPASTGVSSTKGGDGEGDESEDGEDGGSFADALLRLVGVDKKPATVKSEPIDTWEVAVTPSNGGSGALIEVVPASRGGGKPLSVEAASDVNARKLAAVARQQMLDRANEASSSHPLSPSLRCGFTYEWDGLDPQLNGTWYAQEERHEIGPNGSSTNISWKRSPKAKKSDNTDGTEESEEEADTSFVQVNAETRETEFIFRRGGR